MEVRKFEIYHEKNRYKGSVAIEYVAYARDRAEVLRLGEEKGIFFDIDGYTIEDAGTVKRMSGEARNIELIYQF